MAYELITTTRFRRDVKRASKRNLDLSLLTQAIDLLIKDGQLPETYTPHPLTGNFKGYMDAHLAPDWLLIYQVLEDDKEIILIRTGTHSDLFK